VAFQAPRADPEGSFVCRRPNEGEGLCFFLVDDADRTGVVQVDVDGWCVGMVVDGNFLVRSVVDADDFEGGVFEDGFVVRGQGCEFRWATPKMPRERIKSTNANLRFTCTPSGACL
jgi:hypothetical protein